MEKLVLYGVLLVGLVVIAYSLLGLGSASPNGGGTSQLQNTPENDEYYQQQAASSGDICGDLNDPANLQHLSHHPERYQDCLRRADPDKFRQATGRDISEFIGG